MIPDEVAASKGDGVLLNAGSMPKTLMKQKVKKPFHHGNLKLALTEAALELLDESGPDAISIREVARRTGVSHAAPVNHFRDLTALLTHVSTLLFEELGAFIMAKVDETEDGTSDRIGAFARGLIAYGLANPNRYDMLWRRDLVNNDDEDLKRAMDKPYDALIASLPASGEARFDKHTTAILLWSLGHGYVAMRNSGNFEQMVDAVSGRDREDAIVDVVLRSIAGT